MIKKNIYNYSDTNTLVIGGGGFIGSNLIPKLLMTGRKVVVLGRKASPTYNLPSEVLYVQGDYSNRSTINALINNTTEVVYLAYGSIPNSSYEDPLGDLMKNLPGALTLFEVIADKGAKLIYVSSGGTVYGDSDVYPIAENFRTRPISPYGITKLTLENYGYLYSITRGLRYMCLRPSNPYGPGQKPFIGQGFISTAIAKILQKKSVEIYGSQGTVRDYLHISDLGNAIVLAMNCGKLGETYNIGSGIGRSNLDVLDKLKPILYEFGFDISINYLPRRPFDVAINILDSSNLRNISGWMPEIDFSNGLEETVMALMQG
jgi:UDP-glucose 4-epimerase